MKPLIHLNYPLNKELLLKEALTAKKDAKPWESKKGYKKDNWLVSYYSSDYVLKIMNDLNIVGKPRFFYQQPGEQLAPHKDIGTECGVNILISENPLPINIEGEDYYYSQALINLQKMHSVKADNFERILLKYSIPDKPFEQVAKEINYVMSS